MRKKILFLDPFSGISGDMFLASLLDCRLDREKFSLDLESFLPSGVKIKSKKVKKSGFTGTTFKVETAEEQPSRSLKEIRKLIKNSELDAEVIEESLNMFNSLGEAEASIHGTELEEVHFHEIGAVDSIADIVGAALAMERLGIKKLFSAPLNTGTGTVNTRHGRLPIPAPATSKLLEKSNAPIYSTGEKEELVTPTGASIIENYVESFHRPNCKIESTGRGFGSRELSGPNYLRALVGKTESEKEENLVMLETNIDDMNPELFPPVEEKLLSKGALEVFRRPVKMKKNRSGVLVSVLLPRNMAETAFEILARETTTLGARLHPVERLKTERKIKEVSTNWGRAEVKLAYLNDELVNVAPEFESCRKLSNEKGIPLKKIYAEVRDLAYKKYEG
uniref:Protein containing DUF111 n=1 Tax=uncultured organism TaxID=155900 RepID=M1P0D9_9ZZZZ|nr:protein containing DUF111 [uncultured organism]